MVFLQENIQELFEVFKGEYPIVRSMSINKLEGMEAEIIIKCSKASEEEFQKIKNRFTAVLYGIEAQIARNIQVTVSEE